MRGRRPAAETWAPRSLVLHELDEDGAVDDDPIAGVDPLGNLVLVAGRVAEADVAPGEAAARLGARNGFGETPGGPGGAMLRYDMLGDFARLAAEGRFTIPIARTFALEAWREALDISLSGRAHLRPSSPAPRVPTSPS